MRRLSVDQKAAVFAFGIVLIAVGLLVWGILTHPEIADASRGDLEDAVHEHEEKYHGNETVPPPVAEEPSGEPLPVQPPEDPPRPTRPEPVTPEPTPPEPVTPDPDPVDPHPDPIEPDPDPVPPEPEKKGVLGNLGVA